MTKEVPQMRSGPWLLKSRQLLPPPNMKNSTGTGLDQQNCKKLAIGDTLEIAPEKKALEQSQCNLSWSHA